MKNAALLMRPMPTGAVAAAKAKHERPPLLFWLMLPLPLMDSLNGYLNGGANEGGLSLGIVYRVVIILACLAVILRGHIERRTLSLFMVGILILFVPHLLDLTEAFSFASMLVKTILPIMCIEAFYKLLAVRSDAGELPRRLFDIWSVLFPLCILVPFVLRIGFFTYSSGSTGYKGFFFAQNDLCFSLVIIFFYAAVRATRNLSFGRVAVAGLNAVCILLLGLKSGYIFMALILAYCVLTGTMSFARRLALLVFIGLGLALTLTVLSDQIASIVNRWMYFASARDSMTSFLTSGRVERLPLAISYLNSHDSSLWWVFGSGTSYGVALKPYGVIEMDFADLFFQFGICGVIFFVFYYVRFLSVPVAPEGRWLKVALASAFVIAAFAGHVLNAALSGMVFATLCCFILAEGSNDSGRPSNRVSS